MICDHNCFACKYDDCICDEDANWQERVEGNALDSVTKSKLTDAQRRANKKYRESHREEINAYAREYYRRHREERIAYQSAYARSHREQVNVAERARYARKKAAKAAEAAMTANDRTPQI